MSSSNPIGGYFQLELKAGNQVHPGATALNSGRSCLAYILKTQKPVKVYLPYYSCDALLEPLEELKIKHEFYSINKRLEIDSLPDVNVNELFIYINYFGIKDSYCNQLASEWGARLILDYSQAFFSNPPSGSHVFYSPRKFFGLPDGGILYTSQTLDQSLPAGVSWRRASHLLKRVDLGAEKAYSDFKKNEASLRGEPITAMSPLTEQLLANINFLEVKNRRWDNFNFLHKELALTNQLPIPKSVACPMVYPYITQKPGLRQKLVDNKIFVATYWPNVFEWCRADYVEYQLAKNIIPLPIDQRYGAAEMKIILGLINEN